MKISHMLNDFEYGMDASRLLLFEKIQCFITRECENIWICGTQRSHKLVTHDLIFLIPHLACLSVIRVAIRDFLTGDSTPGDLAKCVLTAPASTFRLPWQLIIISFLIQNKHGQLMPTFRLYLHLLACPYQRGLMVVALFAWLWPCWCGLVSVVLA